MISGKERWVEFVKFSIEFTIAITLLTGCNPCGWRCKEALSDYAAFNSIQLKYPTANNFSGIEVELLKGSFGVIGFLNVLNREILSPRVVIEVYSQFYEFQGKIMEGGQRLQLPFEALCLIINTMQEGGSLSIFLEGFATTISPQNFKSTLFSTPLPLANKTE